ncbi:DNA-binding response regulator [Paenibacillus sambharensis]|uniref:DNA-binding response regulator n=1 Tax=Paenibacillus sambharensis TaxID=1803190 RepID=A0A2W1LDT5_9BACL|nr:response regulator transcription factor [Paenibacillus sambharensis]PZD93222.1 DNA-binding response regulator [Paenibacillus sambharensis]
MYKVLLVDDERIILDGISAIVNWASCGTRLIGTARNGIEAKASIERERPDIIITDIKMPGMDGLQLIEQVKEADPDMEFIMLSGFSDFDYARTAMRYGVKDYLLKPCNEQTIEDALKEAAGRLSRKQSKEAFIQKTEEELKRVLPHAREQFLKELVTNRTYGRRDWDNFRRLFNIPVEHDKVRLLLLQIEGEYEFEHIFALKNIAQDLLGEQVLLLSTTIGKQVLLLIRDMSETDLLYALVAEIRGTFRRYYKLEATAAVSDPDDITGARRMYRDTLECLEHRFYLGEGSLITKQDIDAGPGRSDDDFIYDEEQLCLYVKSGHWEDAERELSHVFETLSQLRLETAVTKSYVIPIYVACARQGEPSRIHERLKGLAVLDELDTLQAIREFMFQSIREVCTANYERHRNKHSDMVNRMISCILENLGESRLSLHWVASEILFMNPDYLGKLFKKETGEKFSNYVTRLRMEKAVELIAEADDVKVYELADRLGYGDNPQYFSQVFKKHTGCSPSDYKKTLI